MVQRVADIWLRDAKTPQEREEIKNSLLSEQKVLDKLREILYNMQVSKEASVLADYDTPSWSHKQAHLNGEAAMLRKIIDIVTIRERDDQPQV